MQGSRFWIAATIIAGIGAVHFWNQLRVERQLTARLRDGQSEAGQTPQAIPKPSPALEVASAPLPTSTDTTVARPDAETPSERERSPLDFARFFSESKEASGMHAAFLKQSQDGPVAYEMEDKLRQFYGDRPEVLQYGVPEIQCGPKLCEVRLLANGTNSKSKWAQLMLGSGATASARPPHTFISMAMLEENGMTALTFLVAPSRPDPR